MQSRDSLFRRIRAARAKRLNDAAVLLSRNLADYLGAWHGLPCVSVTVRTRPGGLRVAAATDTGFCLCVSYKAKCVLDNPEEFRSMYEQEFGSWACVLVIRQLEGE